MFINSLDVETYVENEKTYIYCICFLYKENVTTYYGESAIKEFFSFVESRSIKATVYVHNLSFDGGILINNIQSFNYKYSGFYFKGSIYSLTITGENFKLSLRCSYKLFPLSLREILNLLQSSNSSECVQLLKKDNFPHNWINSKNLFYKGVHPLDPKIKDWDTEKAAKEYCSNDVLIVGELVKKIYNEFHEIEDQLNLRKETYTTVNTRDLLFFSSSISSLSLNTYKYFFNKNNLVFKNSVQDDTFIRQAYYGGRCEVFGNTDKNEYIHHFDFTGMYSQVMEDHFPYGKIKKNLVESVPQKDFTIKEGFYKVRVKSSDMFIPVLPRRDDVEDKLTFPNGEWEGLYWWEELQFFMEKGGKILFIFEHWSFEKRGRIFLDFVSFFKKLRCKDPFCKKFWKLFVNSLSGRLGIKPDFTITTLMSVEDYMHKRHKLSVLREFINEQVILVTYERYKNAKENEQTTEANVFIAAAITAKARIRLAKALIKTVENMGRVLYCDTDSVFASFKDKRYGQKQEEIVWDSGSKIIADAVFAIPKGYALKLQENDKSWDEVKLKGFKRNSLSFEEFKKIWKNEEFLKVRELYLHKKNLSWRLGEVEKIIYINNYTKRTFSKDKLTTTPIEVKLLD